MRSWILKTYKYFCITFVLKGRCALNSNNLTILFFRTDIILYLVESVFVINIISLIWVFFTPALVDTFPLESEWQQVSSSILDSFYYSGRSQQYCSLDKSSSPSTKNFEIVQSTPVTIGFRVTFMFHRFQFSFKVKEFITLPSFLPCDYPER